jgi:hypothetical protein
VTDTELDKLIRKLEDVSGGSHSLSEEQNTNLLKAFCQVKPPVIPEAEYRMELIVLSSGGRKGGVSIKPGNVTLNWRKLIGSLPGIVLTGAGAATNPWLFILGARVIWRDLYSTSRVELSPQHATTILTMWNNHDGSKRISEDKARTLTNKALAEFDLNLVSETTFAIIIDDLSQSGCVELSDGEIWLREWIRRSCS